MRRVQLLIIGGGCAGLSLACKLAQPTALMDTLVIEPRATYENDRTWCFWKDWNSGHEHLPLVEWEKLELSLPGDTLTADFAGHQYQMLSSEHFYKDKVKVVEESSNVRMLPGVSAISCRQDSYGCWTTQTNVGVVKSDYVIDTRNQTTSLRGARLWQTFVGYEVECEHPSFDPSIAQLMHFVASARDEVAFVYLLPSSERHALIELTVIARQRPSYESLECRLRHHVLKRVGAQGVRVVRREQGSIPMGIERASERNDSTYVSVGVGAGSARPSSGYTFCRLQRWAEACGELLLRGGNPIGPLPDPPLVQFMDETFLRVIENYPALAPELFLRMFREVPPRRLVRFMGGSPTIGDALAIVAALPKGIFLREAFQHVKGSRNSVEAACLH